MELGNLTFEDADDKPEIRRDGELVGTLLFGYQPDDHTRFGWLLHEPLDESTTLPPVRIGDQADQEQLWESRGDREDWMRRARRTCEQTRWGAIQEAARLLGG